MLQRVSALAGLSLAAGLAYPCLPDAWTTARSAIKTAAIAALAGIAWMLGSLPLALAFALCAAGDFALSRPGDRAFLLGMAAFGAGHLAYVALFMTLGATVTSLTGVAGIASVALLGLAIWMAIRLSKGAGEFAGPLWGYIALIAAMGLAALGLPASSGTGYILVGAGLFIASDVLIGHERFAGLRFRGLGLAIWGLYYVGQGLIMLGVLAQG